MAQDAFNGVRADLTTPWAVAGGSSQMDIERDGLGNARVKHTSRWFGDVGAGYVGGDVDVSECTGLDLTALPAGAQLRPAVRMSATSKGYQAQYTLSGTDIETVRINREDTSSVANSGTLAPLIDATNVDIGITAVDEAGDVRVKVYLNGVEKLSFLDTDPAKILSGDRSGWMANANGSADGAGTEVPEWRDVIGGAGVTIDFSMSGTTTVTPQWTFDLGLGGSELVLDITILSIPNMEFSVGQAPSPPGDLNRDNTVTYIVEGVFKGSVITEKVVK